MTCYLCGSQDAKACEATDELGNQICSTPICEECAESEGGLPHRCMEQEGWDIKKGVA